MLGVPTPNTEWGRTSGATNAGVREKKLICPIVTHFKSVFSNCAYHGTSAIWAGFVSATGEQSAIL